MDFEQTVMELLINAGEARSQSMIAIQQARQNEWEAAETALAAADEAIKAAHKVQTALISEDEGRGKIPVTLILVHAQDHLMTAMLCRDLAGELVLLRKDIDHSAR